MGYPPLAGGRGVDFPLLEQTSTPVPAGHPRQRGIYPAPSTPYLAPLARTSVRAGYMARAGRPRQRPSQPVPINK